jgi:peptidase E
MTKFILHGGMVKLPSANNDNFFREILQAVLESPRILLILFASPKEKWADKEDGYKNKFLDQADGRKIDILVADEDLDILIQQVVWSNVLYIGGGDDLILQRQLEKIPDFEKMIKNKVVAGSSAGALVLAKYYYDNDYDKIYEGLGILPIKIITHYSTPENPSPTKAYPPNEDKRQELENYKEKLPVYAIPETEFVVVDKE